ncbi:MAG: tRNA uridine(34) 5-carboxymethylaminomethyl modification radical SAM/GNAT enzyme Elp3 [Anaerolineaceae bacterium]|nr:tRNA uridine(34) 5-carboxymethylaminomethyl modification radical SAM/GNAT enzyme Elp3 [Anaerolineaceae bacterium]
MIEKTSQETQWRKRREITPEKEEVARIVLEEVRDGLDVLLAIRRHPLPSGGHISKGILVAIYWEGVREGERDADPVFLRKIRKKPMRSLSGVTTVTVLTRPQACPGKCIFCPDDVRMPKSYLPDEPAAARALQSQFDPFVQVENRLRALQNVGHPTDKIEMLILGSSWDAYPIDYREWFVQRCFDALNEGDSESLDEAHHKNETAQHRNVGLTIETRPDMITPMSIRHLRKLGVTRVQLGVQSLNNHILEVNHRGHDINRALEAVAMLRAAGFKIVLHWMPNLLGATPESDIEDFARLWQSASEGLGFSPDELKIYPTQLLENTVLYDRWKTGEYHPYTTEQLINLIAEIKPTIPRYCRLNRVIRDIPSNHVVEGNKRTSLRQDVVQELKHRGQHCSCIRCREVRDNKINPDKLKLIDEIYYPAYTEEHFLEFVTEDDKLAGFLRLSFPNPEQDMAWRDNFLPDLEDAAIIREIHVYGQSLTVGGEQNGAAQHIGLGTALIEEAVLLAKTHGYQHLAVISAIGTHRYYVKRNFKMGESYMIRDI